MLLHDFSHAALARSPVLRLSALLLNHLGAMLLLLDVEGKI